MRTSPVNDPLMRRSVRVRVDSVSSERHGQMDGRPEAGEDECVEGPQGCAASAAQRLCRKTEGVKPEVATCLCNQSVEWRLCSFPCNGPRGLCPSPALHKLPSGFLRSVTKDRNHRVARDIPSSSALWPALWSQGPVSETSLEFDHGALARLPHPDPKTHRLTSRSASCLRSGSLSCGLPSAASARLHVCSWLPLPCG